MNSTLPPRIQFPLAVLLCCAGASAQVERLPSKLKISDTDLASCYEEATGKLLGSQLVRSHVLISPGGRYRAYTEVEAVASRSKTSSDWECTSTSRLFVAAEDQPFRQVLVVEPSPKALGNTVALVDWSPDGRILLFTQGVASQTWSALPDDYKVERCGKYLSENQNDAATSSYVTRGAAPPTDPPASPSAPEQSTRPTPLQPAARKSPRK